MQSINLKLKHNPYSIVVDQSSLLRLGDYLKKLNIGNDAIVITHPVLSRLHGKKLIAGLKKGGMSVKVFEVPVGEKSKSAQTAFSLMEKIAAYDVFKKPFIVAFGGGVIGDLAGYVAAAYKRGIPYVQVPTTFLAQIDSAIGGKVAVDLPVGKNLVGAFYQPKVVWSDVAVLKTLDQRQMRNGLAEAIKYGIIRDQNFFEYLERNYQKVINADLPTLKKAVIRCSQIKADVVLADEKETRNIRTILNFGHTVGHAIEAAGKFQMYQHGEAIALGMRVACEISRLEGLLSQDNSDRINQLITAVKLPTAIQDVTLKNILSHMKHDKKFVAGQNRFVLAKSIGQIKVVDGISMSVIQQAIKKYLV